MTSTTALRDAVIAGTLGVHEWENRLGRALTGLDWASVPTMSEEHLLLHLESVAAPQFGCDISHYQGNFTSWSDFNFIKSSEGNYNHDEMLSRNWTACTKPKGIYHFARAGSCSAATEAAWCIATARSIGLTTQPIALDYEVAPFSRAWAQEWIRLVKAAFPLAKVGIYSMIYGFQALGGPAGIGDFVWLSHPQAYNGATAYPCDILQWSFTPYDRDAIRGVNPFLIPAPPLDDVESLMASTTPAQFAALVATALAANTAFVTAVGYKVVTWPITRYDLPKKADGTYVTENWGSMAHETMSALAAARTQQTINEQTVVAMSAKLDALPAVITAAVKAALAAK